MVKSVLRLIFEIHVIIVLILLESENKSKLNTVMFLAHYMIPEVCMCVCVCSCECVSDTIIHIDAG